MNGIINVTGIRLYGYHGCLEEESQIGGNYVVDVELHADLTQAGATDKLSATLDYVHVNRIVAEEMAVPSHLIEHVCQRIIDRHITELPQLQKITVKVIKVAPPISGNVDNVSVVLTHEKSWS